MHLVSDGQLTVISRPMYKRPYGMVLDGHGERYSSFYDSHESERQKQDSGTRYSLQKHTSSDLFLGAKFHPLLAHSTINSSSD